WAANLRRALGWASFPKPEGPPRAVTGRSAHVAAAAGAAAAASAHKTAAAAAKQRIAGMHGPLFVDQAARRYDFTRAAHSPQSKEPGHERVRRCCGEIYAAGGAHDGQCARRCGLRRRALGSRSDRAWHALRWSRGDRARNHGRGAATSPRMIFEAGKIIDAVALGTCSSSTTVGAASPPPAGLPCQAQGYRRSRGRRWVRDLEEMIERALPA